MKPWIWALALAACASAKPRAQTIAVDAAHENYHTVDGRYRPFADLLRGRGFVMRASEHHLTADALAGIDVLVIANATTPLDDGEIAVIARWVDHGGALWLVADHYPFGGTVAPLARAFGVEMSNGAVGDEAHHWSGDDEPGNIVFTPDSGLARHPITRDVRTVVTFVGQSLRGPKDSVAILQLSKDAQEMKPPDKHFESAAGRAQAIALEVGRGRVFVSAEAAMFTEQTKRNGTAMGMNAAGNDDRQLTINIARWLAREL